MPPPAPTAAPTADEAPPSELETDDAPSDGLLGSLQRARAESAKAQAGALRMAVELWQVNQGVDICPRYDQLIQDSVIPDDVENSDPWDSPYSIECSDEGARVISAGADKAIGTGDDVIAAGSD